MRRSSIWLAALSLLILLAGCGGGAAPDDYFDNSPGPGLSELDFDLVTRTGSSVDSSAVSGYEVDLTHPNYQSADDNLPAGTEAVFAVLLQPAAAPGSGFDGSLTVRPSGKGTSAYFKSRSGNVIIFDDDGDARVVGHITENENGNLNVADLSALGLLLFVESGGGTGFTVSAFADMSQAQAGTQINFWAVAHNQVEPVSYQWSFGDGSSAAGATTSHTYLAPGLYNVSLIASDGSGATAPTASTPIEITAGPNPLTGVTAAEPFPVPGQDFTFTFGATVQGGNPPFIYDWDFDGDGASDSSSPPPVDHAFAGPGFYMGTVTVTDALGDTASDSFITDARRLSLSSDTQTGFAPLRVGFTVDASGPTIGDNIHLDFGDGTAVDNPVSPVEHDFMQPGSYIVSCTWTRSAGGQDYTVVADQLTIEVSQRPPQPFLQLSQPISGQPGQVLPFTLHGMNFGASQGSGRVLIDAVEVPVQTWSDTAITFSPPGGTVSGNVTIENDGGSSNFLHIDFSPGQPSSIQNVLPLDNNAQGHVVLIGHDFEDVPGIVRISGVPMTIEEWDNDAILARLPAGLAAGELPVTVELASGGSAVFSTVLGSGFPPNPVVNSAAPVSEYGAGPSIVIGGGGFGDGYGGLIFCDGVVIPALDWADTLITLGDSPKPVDTWAVVINGAQVSNSFILSDVLRPLIESISPTTGYVGLSIDISGQSFGTQDAGDVVMLNDIELTVNSWSDTLINVTLPVLVADGDIVVRKKLDSNGMPINIIPAPPAKPDLGQI